MPPIIDYIDSEGRTPLSKYAEKGPISQVRKFLAEGASCESKDRQGRTVLMWAVRGRQYPTVKLLLKVGANPEAHDGGDLRADLGEHWKWGRTALIWAADLRAIKGEEQHYLGLQNLMHEIWLCYFSPKGAEVDCLDMDKRTPLLVAAENGCTGVVKLLLEWGADRDIKAYEGSTPLVIAEKDGQKNVKIVTSILKDYYPGLLKRAWTRLKCRTFVYLVLRGERY